MADHGVTIRLSREEHDALLRIAAETGSVSPQGINAGQPSLNTLIRNIAKGNLGVKGEAPEKITPAVKRAASRTQHSATYLANRLPELQQRLADGETVDDLIDELQGDGERSEYLIGLRAYLEAIVAGHTPNA